MLFDRIIDPNLLIRRMYLVANHVIPESDAPQPARCEQLDLFTDYAAEQERRRQSRPHSSESESCSSGARHQEQIRQKRAAQGHEPRERRDCIERNGKIGGHNA